MSASSFYWDHSFLQGFGDLWFLKMPQLTGQIGSGDKLLGSVLPRLGWGFDHYPAPQDFMESQYILNELQTLSAELSIKGVISVEEKYAGATTATSLNNSLAVSADPFLIPSIPLKLGFKLDYSSVKSFAITFGDDTVGRYIPTDYLVRLYQHFKGQSKSISPGRDISSQYFCDSVLLTGSYVVTVTAKTDFSADVSAGLTSLPGAPNVALSLKNSNSNSFSLEIKRTDGKQYLIGLGTTRWDQLG